MPCDDGSAQKAPRDRSHPKARPLRPRRSHDCVLAEPPKALPFLHPTPKPPKAIGPQQVVHGIWNTRSFGKRSRELWTAAQASTELSLLPRLLCTEISTGAWPHRLIRKGAVRTASLSINTSGLHPLDQRFAHVFLRPTSFPNYGRAVHSVPPTPPSW